MNSNIKLKVFSNYEALSSAAADIFINIKGERDKNTFIVPGGNTPQLFFELLSNRVRDWADTNLILSDERQVKINDENSNEGSIKSKIYSFNSSGTTPFIFSYLKNNRYPMQKIPYEMELAAKVLTPITATFLGLGSDGHTASIFSLDNNIFNSNSFFTIVQNQDESYKRITVNPKILYSGKSIIFIVHGKSKAQILDYVLNENNPINFPAQRIINEAKIPVTILCDQSAANSLNQ